MQLISILGKPEKQLSYNEIEAFLSKETSKDTALSRIEIIQSVLDKYYSKCNINPEKVQIYIYESNNQRESIVTGYWFGLVSKKAGIFRVPYFVVYEDKVLYGSFYQKPMPKR